ncbi:hypothetical protein, partial [Ruminococcus callidus]|uniref:hypothetical protein n=1 Tax=Ruminococcus callidus TaxID=40519 RepID=UPI003FD857D6
QEKISPESLHQLRWSPSLFKGGLFQNKKNLFCICAYTDVKQVLREHRIKLVRKMRRQIFWQIAQKFRRQTACLARDFWAIWRKICKQIAYKAVRRALFRVSVRKKWESALMEQAEST